MNPKEARRLWDEQFGEGKASASAKDASTEREGNTTQSKPAEDVTLAEEWAPEMKKVKSLWARNAVLRWTVYQSPIFLVVFLLREGFFDFQRKQYSEGSAYIFSWDESTYLVSYRVFIWVFALTLPAVWVWRKPLFGFLNRAAE